MNKVFRALGASFIFIIVFLGIMYVLLGRYYSNGFPCCTWINGVYCTGKTAEEVNNELVEKIVYPGITLYGPNGESFFVASSDVDFSVDYTYSLEQYLSNINPYAWGAYVFRNMSAVFKPNVFIDEEKFIQKVLEWDIFEDEDELYVAIEKSDNGYKLVDGLSHIPNKNNIIAASFSAMSLMDSAINLGDFDYTFTDIPLSTEDKETVRTFEKIDYLQNCDISFTLMGEKISLSEKDIAEFILTEDSLEEAKEEKVSKKDNHTGYFIMGGEEKEFPSDEEIIIRNGFVLDSNGNLIIRESKIYDLLANISKDYGTAWLMNRYRHGVDDEIAVNNNQKGDGSLFDIDAEFEEFKQTILSGDFGDQNVIMLDLMDSVKLYNASESLGNTYIEVDMGAQQLTYYVDGEVNMQMPVVTGNINRKRGTITGIYDIYNKRYHTYLRGQGYVSYVNYWLGVNKGVGIHDATWRDEFGGEIYKTDGSHGCINCPEEQVLPLWEVVEVGTPVILFY